jgi:hypothetical protein
MAYSAIMDEQQQKHNDHRPQEETGETIRHVDRGPTIRARRILKEKADGRRPRLCPVDQQGTLFKHKDKESRSSDNKRKEESPPPSNRQSEEGSDEYWNQTASQALTKAIKEIIVLV